VYEIALIVFQPCAVIRKVNDRTTGRVCRNQLFHSTSHMKVTVSLGIHSLRGLPVGWGVGITDYRH
jgi:hypothetical protein